jgi:hypothetical protein
LPLGLSTWASGSSRAPGPATTRESSAGHPLLDLRPPTESSRLRAAGRRRPSDEVRPLPSEEVRRLPPGKSDTALPKKVVAVSPWCADAVLPKKSVALAPRKSCADPASSLEVCSPYSVSPLTAAASCPALPQPAACASRFSQPLDASIRREPGGLVSCHIRSWGCALQSFAPPVQPYAVSGAVALLTSPHPRRSSRPSPSPTEAGHEHGSPSRAADHKSSARSDSPPLTIDRSLRLAAARCPSPPAEADSSKQRLTPHRRPKPAIRGGPSSLPGDRGHQLERTSGTARPSQRTEAHRNGPGAPSPSGLCSTRESATTRRRFRPPCSA